MAAPPIPLTPPAASAPAAWTLPENGLSVFYGLPETLRLFHYFLPAAILRGRPVLCLDGANRFDPLLIARLARERGRRPAELGRGLRIARAFTCFQLTELLARVPRLLRGFPARIVIVTAMPDLYFDEDVREREAVASFARALHALRVAQQMSVPVAVFSDAASSASQRRVLFQHLVAEAAQVLRFTRHADTGLALTCEKRAPLALP